MKSQKDIRIRIAQIKQENSHLLEGSPASVEVNAPRAIFQVRIIALLDSLYWKQSSFRRENNFKRKHFTRNRC